MQAGMTHQPRRDAKDYKKSRKELDFAAGIEGGRDLTYLIYKDLSSPLIEPGMKTAKLYLFDFLMLTATKHC